MSILPAILEVGIGVVLIFLTLSAMCSSLAEMISNLLELRSRYLRQGIITLLTDPEEIERQLAGPIQIGSLAAQVLSHPRLQKLNPLRQENRFVQWIRARVEQDPILLAPAVPSALFSSVLVEELRKRSPNYGMRLMTLRIRLKTYSDDLVQGMDGELSPIPPLILEAINQRDARQALEDVRQTLPLIADDKVRSAISNLLNTWELEQVRQGISTLPPSRPREILLSLLNQVQEEGNRVEHFQEQVAGWFDSGMDQVSQWYKQHINVFLRVAAVAVCVFLNADVVHIVDGLWRDPTLRAALVAEAQSVNQSTGTGQQAGVNGQAQDNALALEWQLAEVSRLPLGWNCDEWNSIVRDGYQSSVTAPGKGQAVGFCADQTRLAANGRLETVYAEGGSLSLLNLFYKVLGLSLMSIGVSLGANFWYKLLKQLLSLKNERAS